MIASITSFSAENSGKNEDIHVQYLLGFKIEGDFQFVGKWVTNNSMVSTWLELITWNHVLWHHKA